MSENSDKYADSEEDLTQVRNIIKQLNEDKPSREKTREVVVRADGTKVVRVTKKRRVMVTSAEKRRQSRRQILLMLAGVFVVLVAVAGFIMFRMATMSSTAYLEEKRAELQRLWGAADVQLEGAGIEGTSLSLSSVVVEFPEESMLKRVELTGVQTNLEMVSFISGKLKASRLVIDRAQLVLRNGAGMHMPRQKSKDMWVFRNAECRDFSVVYADDSQAPMSLTKAQAYMYYPGAARDASVVVFSDGELDVRGWKKIRIKEGKAHVSTTGIDDFSIVGTVDAVSDEIEQRRTSISLAGKLPHGSIASGPFSVEAENMSLAEFTDGRFEEFFTARTVGVSHGKPNGKFTMTLTEGAAPRFAGELHLKDICLSSFPALMAITEHIEPAKRRLYNPLSISRGYIILGHDGMGQTLEIPEGGISERDLAKLEGKVGINDVNELSGNISYGIPAILARAEYSDGLPDPIFQPNGEWAELRTNVRGFANKPDDDIDEIEARAQIERRTRPERIPFDQLDVDRLTEQMLKPSANPNPAVQEAAQQKSDTEQPFIKKSELQMPDSFMQNPYEFGGSSADKHLPF